MLSTSKLETFYLRYLRFIYSCVYTFIYVSLIAEYLRFTYGIYVKTPIDTFTLKAF